MCTTYNRHSIRYKLFCQACNKGTLLSFMNGTRTKVNRIGAYLLEAYKLLFQRLIILPVLPAAIAAGKSHELQRLIPIGSKRPGPFIECLETGRPGTAAVCYAAVEYRDFFRK